MEWLEAVLSRICQRLIASKYNNMLNSNKSDYGRYRYKYIGNGHVCTLVSFSKESAVRALEDHYGFEIDHNDVLEVMKLGDSWFC